MGDDIHKKISLRTEASRGSQIYLSHYQAACTSVIKELSEERLKEIEDLAEEWNKGSVPEDVMRR